MSTDAATISEAKQWCIDTRKVLNLSRKERNQLDLKSRSSSAAENLNKLQGKVPQGVYDRMKKGLLEVAGRLHNATPTSDRGQVEIDAERLNVIACESKSLLKDDKSSQKDLDKALAGLGKSLLSHVASGGSPEDRGKALAQQILAMAEGGATISSDVKAINHLAKTADPGSDEQKAADAACKQMIALGAQKAKALGPSDQERDEKRMPSEVMVQLLATVRAEMKTNDSADLKKLERSVNFQILQHKLTVADTKKFLADAKGICEKAGSPKLKDLCAKLVGELPATDAEAPVTRLQDNIYGRVFDSALVSNLVKAPPESVKQASKATGEGFQKFLATVKPEQVAEAAGGIQKLLKGEDDHEDPRFWIEKVPALQKLRDADPKDAVKVLNEFLAADKGTGPECMAVPWLLVKLSLSLKEIGAKADVQPEGLTGEDLSNWHKDKGIRMFASAPWMKKANENYQTVAKQKSNTKPGDVTADRWTATNAATEGSGITLKHQPNAVENEGYGTPSTRPANLNLPGVKRKEVEDENKKKVSTGEIEGVQTEAMKQALEHGLPYASGASGSTNIMLHLTEYMNSKGLATIDPKDALLGTTMFLVGDGGHSLQEVLYTANAMDEKLGLNMGFKGGKPEEFVADYEEFIGMYGDSESGKALQQASDGATNRVAEYFEEHSHYSEQDKGTAGPVKTDWPTGEKKSPPTTDTAKDGGKGTAKQPTTVETGGQPKKTPPKVPPKPQARTSSAPPAPADTAYGDMGSPNPSLYFIPNNAGGKNFRVDSKDPGGDWAKVEQFCAYLAAYWLANGKTGGLKFSDLGGSQAAAVQTLISWGDSGGLAAQVAYAKQAIGGNTVDKAKLLDDAKQGKIKDGMKIWFGSEAHSRAATVGKLKMVTVYDPNTGGVSRMTGSEFAANAQGDSSFVMSGG